MLYDNVGRNDPCPCGSGKKFKRCHLGREDQIVEQSLSVDPYQTAQKICQLEPCGHPNAERMAAGLDLTSKAGKKLTVRFVDLAAYQALGLAGESAGPKGPGGLFINPQRTRPVEPGSLYIALSPDAHDSDVVHLLAHVVDYVSGSGLGPGAASEKADLLSLPAELLEHPQEYGDALLELSRGNGIELDAEDEIVAFLARRQMLLPGKMVAAGKREELLNACQKTMGFMRDAKDEIDARIKGRRGYAGRSAGGDS